MIDQLTLDRFKRFSHLDLLMRRLTVLTGTNGAGKTSVIHALLIAQLASLGRSVKLNGPFCLQLGEGTDVLFQGAEDPTIGIQLLCSGQPFAWTLEVSERRVLYLDRVAAPEAVPFPFGHPGPALTYLCAERLGPRQHLPVDAVSEEDIGVGSQGEFVAHVLALKDSTRVSEGRRLPGLDSLKHQTEAWAARILHPLRIEAAWPEGLTVSEIRFQTSYGSGSRVRPPNMGFGVSYALPIIVAGLTVPSGGLLIVENPEAHLHPAGQSQIGWFLAQVAADGVQVVLETHSDHVVNGIRKALAGEGVTLRPEDSVIHFFDHQQEGAIQLEVKSDGSVSAWPPRFFDQSEKDLAELVRLRRTRKPE